MIFKKEQDLKKINDYQTKLAMKSVEDELSKGIEENETKKEIISLAISSTYSQLNLAS